MTFDSLGPVSFVHLYAKQSVTLVDPLGPEILTKLEIKGQVLHRLRLHLKVPGSLSDFSALLTGLL